MDIKGYGQQGAVLKTVFVYKVNFAMALLLMFINLQTLINNLLMGFYQVWTVYVVTASIIISFLYGIVSANAYATKIILYTKGIRIKKLLFDRFIYLEDIENIDMLRKNILKKRIVLHTKNGKKYKINTASFVDASPLLRYIKEIE